MRTDKEGSNPFSLLCLVVLASCSQAVVAQEVRVVRVGLILEQQEFIVTEDVGQAEVCAEVKDEPMPATPFTRGFGVIYQDGHAVGRLHSLAS